MSKPGVTLIIRLNARWRVTEDGELQWMVQRKTNKQRAQRADGSLRSALPDPELVRDARGAPALRGRVLRAG